MPQFTATFSSNLVFSKCSFNLRYNRSDGAFDVRSAHLASIPRRCALFRRADRDRPQSFRKSNDHPISYLDDLLVMISKSCPYPLSISIKIPEIRGRSKRERYFAKKGGARLRLHTRTEHLAEKAGKRFRVPKIIILIDDFIVPGLVFLQLNGSSSPRTELRVLEKCTGTEVDCPLLYEI